MASLGRDRRGCSSEFFASPVAYRHLADESSSGASNRERHCASRQPQQGEGGRFGDDGSQDNVVAVATGVSDLEVEKAFGVDEGAFGLVPLPRRM